MRRTSKNCHFLEKQRLLQFYNYENFDIIPVSLNFCLWSFNYFFFFFGLSRFRADTQKKESNLTVLCLLIFIILIGYIIIKLSNMENHPSQNQKWNSFLFCLPFQSCHLLAFIRTKQSALFHRKFAVKLIHAIWKGNF